MKKILITLLILLIAAAAISANGSQESGSTYGQGSGQGPRDGSGYGRGNGGGGYGGGQGRNAAGTGSTYRENFNDELASAYQSELGSGVLSEQETEGLLLMVEEEKLARDVYLKLYELWNLPVFNNIAESEQQHMEAVGLLLEAYDIAEPAESGTPGVYNNSDLQEYYNALTEQGSESIEAALNAGATIEDLDIADLQKLIDEADNTEVKILYQNLMKGSRNHMRSFTAQLDRYGENYDAQFISSDYLEKILKYNRETAPITDPDYSI